MSDITTTTARSKLTVGLDMGDRFTQVCVLDEDGDGHGGRSGHHDAQSFPAALRRYAARPTCAGGRHSFSLGQSAPWASSAMK